ncbi:MAG TPA: molybdenum cofactor guanylyltransferase [Thermodesulfovibrionales bacterium]|nr:molybdenum cofactor guanylyltransferase [Thermodesulfovibrionales bacterium]
MTAAILSGGENSRIPHIKGFLAVEGETIIGRSLEVLKKVFGRVVISTNSPEWYFRFGVPLIGDVRKEKGPMIGILSVLAATGDDLFVAACDMPFLNEGLIRVMADTFRAQSAEGGGGCDAVVPLFRGKKEPLLAIYSVAVAETIERMLSGGKRGLIEMLDRMDVRYIPEEEVMRVDPQGRSFVNINTMEDYHKIAFSGQRTDHRPVGTPADFL